mmetsp:Transcript_12626/g.27924  ORF Transcript_12626/g.27924 Transcript_12626/m.27924 type:complete len:137 (-) Transcript_12626:7-417(-)
MYFVVSGSLGYDLGQSTAHTQAVQMRDTISEAVLWLTWRHRGRLTAIYPCTLVALDAEKFRNVLCHSSSIEACRTYAQAFKHHVVPLGDDELQDLSDVTQESALLKRMVKQAFPRDSENQRRSIFGIMSSRLLMRF